MSGMRKRVLILIVGAMLLATALSACLGETKPAVNKPPTARISSPATGSVFDTGVVITFDGSQSKDPEKKAITLKWDFGDNSTNSTGNTTTHSYALLGRYMVTLTVSDGKKTGMDRIELRINQANRAPVVRFNVTRQNASNEELVEFNASATTDADNDTLTFSWDFGDTTNGSGKVVTHKFTTVGSYIVTLNVSDGKTMGATSMSISVYQANRPPVPVLSASPLVAFLNSDIEFNALFSTDLDNDTLTATWAFGDGSNGTGLVVKHSFAKVGNFTVIANISDGKLTRTAQLIVTVIPRARILVDWNGTDFGYILKFETNVEKANVSGSVKDLQGVTDMAPQVTELTKDTYRIKTMVVPQKSHTLTVAAWYLGSVSGQRNMTIYDGQPMPGVNASGTVGASISTHKYSNTSDEQTTMTGTGVISSKGSTGTYSVNVSGIGNSSSVDGDKRTTGNMTLNGSFSMVMDWGTQTQKTQSYCSAGNMSQFNTTSGMEVIKLYSESVMRALDRNTTYYSIFQNGTMSPFAIKANYSFVGIEDHANGAGKVYSCLKVHMNGTLEGTIPYTGHILMFMDETSWGVRDERYDNTTIYKEFNNNAYLVNDTTGNWTFIPQMSSSGTEFPDADGNGVYNPDLKPVSIDDAFTFNGPVPREMVVGDRIVGTNMYGVKVVLEALDESTMTVDGKAYAVVHVKSTFSSASGNATGASEGWLVSLGNLTGMSLKSKENKTWSTNGVTETNVSEIIALTLKEDQ
jgi:hypothetical protein